MNSYDQTSFDIISNDDITKMIQSILTKLVNYFRHIVYKYGVFVFFGFSVTPTNYLIYSI